MTRKTRNTEWGYGRWLGNEWVEAIANGEPASREAARELADEVRQYRKLRRLLAEEARTYGDLLEERFGRLARSMLLSLVSRLCNSNDLYGDAPAECTLASIDRESILRLAAAPATATPADVEALIAEALMRRAAMDQNSQCPPTGATTGEVER